MEVTVKRADGSKTSNGKLSPFLMQLYKELHRLADAKVDEVGDKSTFLGLEGNEKAMVLKFSDLSYFLAASLSMDLTTHIEATGAKVEAIRAYTHHFGERKPVEHQSLHLGNGEISTGIRTAWAFIRLPSGTKAVVHFELECTHNFMEDVRYILVYFKSSKDAAAEMSKWIESLRHTALTNSHFKGKVIEVLSDNAPVKTLDIESLGDGDIILSDEQRHVLESDFLASLRNRERLKELGVRAQRAMILEGPPGNGKTMTGRWVWGKIKPLGFSMIIVSPACFSYSTAFALNSIFGMAKDLEPCLVWFEDIDLIGEDRGSDRTKGFLGSLLAVLDGLENRGEVYIAATTNKVEVLDDALRHRPGRFDVRIHYGNPMQEERSQMLERFAWKAVSKGAIYGPPAWVVKKTEGFSGAYLRELVDRAVILAVSKSVKEGECVWERALGDLKKDVKNDPTPVGFVNGRV